MNATIRVLVVDDFNKFREWLCLKLKTNGLFFIAGEAANAREAIQKARELSPDLILLDLFLPDMNGFDVHQELRRTVPSAKVLFLSGCGDENIVRRALSEGHAATSSDGSKRRSLANARRPTSAEKRSACQRHATSRSRCEPSIAWRR